MKKSLLISAAILVVIAFGNFSAQAQVSDVSGNVTVNITLTDAISIELGTDPQTVNFSYPDAAAYSVRQDELMENHFKVISNKGYSLKVTGSGDFVGPLGVTIDLNTVSVNVAATTPITTVTGAAIVPLAIAPGTEIITGTATTTRSYDINYAIPLPKVENLLGKTGLFTTTVFYTVTQL